MCLCKVPVSENAMRRSLAWFVILIFAPPPHLFKYIEVCLIFRFLCMGLNISFSWEKFDSHIFGPVGQLPYFHQCNINESFNVSMWASCGGIICVHCSFTMCTDSSRDVSSIVVPHFWCQCRPFGNSWFHFYLSAECGSNPDPHCLYLFIFIFGRIGWSKYSKLDYPPVKTIFIFGRVGWSKFSKLDYPPVKTIFIFGRVGWSKFSKLERYCESTEELDRRV